MRKSVRKLSDIASAIYNYRVKWTMDEREEVEVKIYETDSTRMWPWKQL
jgi:hypothetical protein